MNLTLYSCGLHSSLYESSRHLAFRIETPPLKFLLGSSRVLLVCKKRAEKRENYNKILFRLARQYTNNEDIVVVEDAFHGNLGTLIDVSPKMHEYVPNFKEKEFVHVTPKPSSFRLSPLLGDDVELPQDLVGEDLDKWIASKCADRVETTIAEATSKGRKIAAFLHEPCFVMPL